MSESAELEQQTSGPGMLLFDKTEIVANHYT